MAQIESGEELKAAPVNNLRELEAFRANYSRWDSYSAAQLRAFFTGDEKPKRYNARYLIVTRNKDFYEQVADVKNELGQCITYLWKVCDELELIPLDESVQASTPAPAPPKAISNKVFVVHGHDDSARLEVAVLLKTLKLKPIVLHEQRNRGKTLIEKFEANSDVSFAVVLLTPDDVGAARPTFDERKSKALASRARENVVFEMGFFFAKLGRENVCALLKGDTGRPSDISGVVYQSMDPGGAWKIELAKEMMAAGLPVAYDELFQS